jgi:MHS family proline/betaine transporter-like MFS transporter
MAAHAGPVPAAGKIAVAAGIGNVMEWFDFAVYGFFATTIGHVFFPTKTATSALLSSLAVFGVAFVMRPLGGLLLGAVGDRAGRRAALAVSVTLMGAATTLIAALPTYAGVGILAPVLLILLRCAQGISAGGEWTGASSFLVEYAPQRRRGLRGSVISATGAIGSLLGCVVALVLTSALSPAQMTEWGWRIPFLLAAPLGAAGLYVRLRLEDTPVFRDLQQEDRVTRTPIREAVTKNLRQIVVMFFCTTVGGVGYYYMATYVVNFLAGERLGIGRSAALAMTAVGLAAYAVLCPCAGVLSDRIGRRASMLICTFGFFVAGIPAFLLMAGLGVPGAIWGIVVLGVFEAIANVNGVVLLVELFPARTRMTSASIGYNISLAAIAGPGPLIAAALAAGIDFVASPAFYMSAVAFVAFLVVARFLPETSGRAFLGDDSAPWLAAQPAGRRAEDVPAGGA